MYHGLSHADIRAVKKLLLQPHWIDVEILVLNMEHDKIDDISDLLQAGQVDFDTKSEVTRTLQMELANVEGGVPFSGDGAGASSIYLKNMIQVTYSIAPPDQSVWYDIELFVGPITGYENKGTSLAIVCKDKSILAFSSIWSGRTFKKGWQIDKIIQYILLNWVGEHPDRIRLRMSSKKTIHKNVVVGEDAIPWPMIKKYSKAIDKEAWYDGQGNARIQKWSKRAVYTYSDQNMCTQPTFTYDPSTLVNAVKVIGGKPPGSKKKVRAKAIAAKRHPLSPWSLRRNGKKRYYKKVINDSSIKSKKAAKKRAREELEKGLLEGLAVQFDALPNPLHTEGDVIRIKTDSVQANARLQTWSVPLTHDGRMSIGVKKKVSFKGKRQGPRSARRNRSRNP